MRILKRTFVFSLTLLLLIPSLSFASPSLTRPDYNADIKIKYFSDVLEAHPFADSIGYLKARGTVKGYPDATFAPDNSISRAEFITMVMAGMNVPISGANCFKDVKNEWFAKFVCSAKARGLIRGYADGTFRPANNINFAEAALIMAKANRITVRTASRGEMWYKPAIQKLAAQAAIPTSIDYVEKKLSRAEVAEILWRLKAKIKSKPAKTYASLTAELPTLSSCAELKEKIAFSSYVQQRNTFRLRSMDIAMDGVEESAAPSMSVSQLSAGDGVGATDYSSTNVQVAGVDEADIIKNDGQYIYMVSSGTVRIVRAYPPENMQEVSKLKVADANFQASEIYVSGTKLVVIGTSYSNEEGNYRNGAKVYVIDVSDKSNPREVRSVEFDGYAISSRRIGSRVFLAINKSPNYYRILENDTEVEDTLPHVKDSGGAEGLAVPCGEIRFFPHYDAINYLLVAGLDIENSDAPLSQEVIMGVGSTVYASASSMYVATPRYSYPEVGIFDLWMPSPADSEKTVVYRFSLENGDIKYKTKGEVSGHILNQFAMDEEGEAFRIATTTGQVWSSSDPSKNHLYILNKNNLEERLGKITDIAPGEKIYSIRFLGKRAYMVTFKKVDPFFVIDVENPRAPKILGELKIPGYSDYLHPFDENHVIGFGKDAVDPATLPKNSFRDFDFAWYQGMKIALFDVTDVANPKAVFKETIGDRGTESELLHNHKALLYDASRNLFAFPVTVAKVSDDFKDELQPGDPGSRYGKPVFQGAYVYTLDLENGFTLKGTITHYEDLSVFENQNFYWYDNANNIERILYMGDYLYTISPGKIKATKREDMIEANSISFDVAKQPEPEPLPM